MRWTTFRDPPTAYILRRKEARAQLHKCFEENLDRQIALYVLTLCRGIV